MATITLTEAESALLKSRLISADILNRPFGEVIDSAQITQVDAKTTPAGPSLIKITHKVKDRIVTSVPLQVQRENLAKVINQLDIANAAANLDFAVATEADLVTALLDAGLNVGDNALKIIGRNSKLLIVECTPESPRFEGMVRFLAQ